MRARVNVNGTAAVTVDTLEMIYGRSLGFWHELRTPTPAVFFSFFRVNINEAFRGFIILHNCILLYIFAHATRFAWFLPSRVYSIYIHKILHWLSFKNFRPENYHKHHIIYFSFTYIYMIRKMIFHFKYNEKKKI